MLKVEEFMTADPLSLREADDLGHAETILALGRIRHLPVTRAEKLVGLITHRDILKALGGNAPAGKRATLAGELMKRDVVTVGRATSLRDAALLMLKHKLGCLPVIDGDGRLVGIITEADLVRFAAQMAGADDGND